jgi:hypothetical protein
MTLSRTEYDHLMRVTYASLHELIDRLTPEQAEALWTVARNMAPSEPVTPATPPPPPPPQPTRTIAFSGTLASQRAAEQARLTGDRTTIVSRPNAPQ